MMEDERVCCMCGDVGFPDKIFGCIKCRHRFQHSYVSPYLCLLHKHLYTHNYGVSISMEVTLLIVL
ncbi:hypothetical protein Hanom_Chr04g00288591 [Helianthus anomalus]